MDYNSTKLNILSNIAITIVGFQIVRRVLPWLYVNLIGPKLFGPKIDVRQISSWAVVTGATDGIGKAYAKALAKKGLNLILISRSQTKLENVAKEIGEAYSVEIKIIDVDFTHGQEIYDKIKKHTENLDVGVLVNNVGMSYEHPEFFLEYCEKNQTFLRDIVSVNIHSVTHMCQLLLPAMVKKGKGVIINLSSTAAVVPNPLLTVYSATKAFVDKFSADLRTEYKSKGIIVQSVQPGFVVSNMTKIRKPTVLAPSADAFVESALSTLGIAGHTAGYFPHALLQLVVATVACLLGNDFARNMVFKNLLATRQRALRNLAKKQ